MDNSETATEASEVDGASVEAAAAGAAVEEAAGAARAARTAGGDRSAATEFEWNIIPLLNPDGYEFSRTTDRMWRKNRRNGLST